MFKYRRLLFIAALSISTYYAIDMYKDMTDPSKKIEIDLANIVKSISIIIFTQIIPIIVSVLLQTKTMLLKTILSVLLFNVIFILGVFSTSGNANQAELMMWLPVIVVTYNFLFFPIIFLSLLGLSSGDIKDRMESKNSASKMLPDSKEYEPK